MSKHQTHAATSAPTSKNPKDAAKDLADDAKAHADTLGDKARSIASDKAAAAKAQATHAIEDKADDLRAAGRSFEPGSYEAQAADYVATNLTRAADFVRHQDLSSVTSDLTRFARQNPALFLGGAAIAGFALSRLLKASEADRHPVPAPQYARATDYPGAPR
ncbi:MAG: hypothetical protein WBA67_00020 [Jannaschia sp.]